MQTFDKGKTYSYGINPFKVCESEILRKIRCKVWIINFDDYINENKTVHNKNWSYILDHPCRILIIGGSEFGKTNTLINLINEQNDIDKIYLCARDLNEPKYKYLIKTRGDVEI